MLSVSETKKKEGVFYASGTRGKSVRADGEGGSLARGWYYFRLSGLCVGPFATCIKAAKAKATDV